jgi:hypothetical protein
VKTYVAVWVGAAMVLLAIRSIWWDRELGVSWYWVAPAILMLMGVVIILLGLRVSALVWYATPQGLTGPEQVGRFVSWNDIRSISLNAEDRKIQQITPSADQEARNRVVRIEARDRWFRLVLPYDHRYRTERLLVRHSQHAAVFVESTGEAFPPTQAPSLDLTEGLVARARSAARKYGLSAAGYMLVLLLCLLVLAVVVWWCLRDGILSVPLEPAFWVVLLASGSAVGARKSWKHARLLSARARRVEEDFRDGSRREELLRARQRFGIRGLWCESVSGESDSTGRKEN